MPVAGDIVKIVSEKSVHRGECGFICKVHDSGRFGVTVGEDKKISHTHVGVHAMTEALPGERRSFERAKSRKERHFSLPPDPAVNGDDSATSSMSEDAAPVPETSRSSTRTRRSSLEEKVDKIAVAVEAIIHTFNAVKQESDGHFRIAGEALRDSTRRVERLEARD